jgi:2-methylisocitrate lyase-like PEP mutase family enzyme
LSQLRKVIERSQRGEGTRMGFGAVVREKPRAMALGVLARDGDGAKAAIEAGADFVVFRAQDTAGALEALKTTGETKAPLGVWLSQFGTEDTAKLASAGADFVASPLDGTVAEAVDPDQMGQVLAITGEMEEAILRSLGSLGLDGLFVKRPAGQMTLQQQVELARLATLSGVPLLVSTADDVSAGELRVLRDAGAVAIVASDGSTQDEIRALNERLREVPARRSRSNNRETPMLPTAASREHEHDHDDDED